MSEKIPYTLRNYQKKAVSDTYNLIRQSVKRILLVSATGSGKTLIATKVIFDAVSRNKRVLFVVHRDILIAQTYNKFAAVGLNCGFFKAGWEENIDANVQIASVQTLPNRQKWKECKFDLIIFDECHLVAFSSICQQIMQIFFPDAIYLGLTATPWRLSKKESLGDIYSALVCTPMPKELIQSNFLVKPSYYGLDFDVSLDEMEVTNGDYNVPQLNTVCDRPELIQQLCHSWFDLGYKRRSVAFAVGVKHAENIAKAFLERGIEAAVVTGKTPISERNQLYKQLGSGKLLVLASCGALSEGFDVPEVSCVMLARPTKSKALYFQQLGRGLRLAPAKHDCLVLDQSQNVIEHGFIEDLEEIELSLSEEEKNKIQGKAPLKICPTLDGGCGVYIYATCLRCPHCGYNFDLKKLVSVLGTNRLAIATDKEKLVLYRELLRHAYSNGYAPTWAAVKFKEKYNFFPPFDWGRGAVFNHQKTDSLFELYQDYLGNAAKRLNKDLDWVKKYLYLEFGHDLTLEMSLAR
ncbi:DEAD/DEAH box helicase [Myxosarcina sp. GI1]|uniref:DEAD/DEAH box helicase n=1 Tax=Myxosarcina sp. GI1 TaxID=1541065 RepID=UPI00056AF9EB|nr:DEAD/DEAH box helicase [Myxosarcina sp. GI1]